MAKVTPWSKKSWGYFGHPDFTHKHKRLATPLKNKANVFLIWMFYKYFLEKAKFQGPKKPPNKVREWNNCLSTNLDPLTEG